MSQGIKIMISSFTTIVAIELIKYLIPGIKSLIFPPSFPTFQGGNILNMVEIIAIFTLIAGGISLMRRND